MTAIFILGGARSGKSRHALRMAEEMAERPVFIATAQAEDEEMRRRIDRHRSERGAHWAAVEAPFDLAGAIVRLTAQDTAVVDCLTLWLSNAMREHQSPAAEIENLIEAIRESSATLILVSNEVGLGIVPATPLGREFRDEQGRLNQRLAEIADRVIFVAAGLPLTLKPQQ